MSEEKIEAVWNYCRDAGLFTTRDNFEHNIAEDLRRGISITDLAVHIRVHGRYIGKTAEQIEDDLTDFLKVKKGENNAES